MFRNAFNELLYSQIFALSFFLFKLFSSAGLGSLGFWEVAFWEYVGFVVTGIFLLVFIKKYRVNFVKTLKEKVEERTPMPEMSGEHRSSRSRDRKTSKF